MLELIDIKFERDNKKILKGINLKVEDNKFLAITGPNGSGKSTLAKIIMGIEKPDSGRIIFNGKDITMNVCIQIRDVIKLLQQHFHITFEEAVLRFYKSETYKTLQETENGLWAESAEYMADRYYEENQSSHN